MGPDPSPLMLKLEQLTALVVAAGLAVVSYWLFFSWAGGGGYERRGRSEAQALRSESTPGFHQPLSGLAVVETVQMRFDVLGSDRQSEGFSYSADALHRA